MDFMDMVYGGTASFGKRGNIDTSSIRVTCNPSWPIQADYVRYGLKSSSDTAGIDDKEVVAGYGTPTWQKPTNQGFFAEKRQNRREFFGAETHPRYQK